MPELPELEIIAEFLNAHILNKLIVDIDVRQPLVLRCTMEALTPALLGRRFDAVARKGKFLQFQADSQIFLVINPMLSGRFQYISSEAKTAARTCLRVGFEDGHELRYIDSNLMGKIYLVRDDFSSIPKYLDMGPEANDPNLSLSEFTSRLKKYRGMIKNVLTNHKCIAGIGNAYADEILFVAGVLPTRLASTLTSVEVKALYTAIGAVLNESIAMLRTRMGAAIDVKIRDFLRVHNKKGQPCPQCGGAISETRANQRITSYCRRCQR